MILTLPVALFPEEILYPLLGNSDSSLMADTQDIFYLLIGILSLFAIGGIYFNGLAGTGATLFGLKIQAWCALVYLVYIYVVVNLTNLGLVWAWSAEILYWIIILVVTIVYLRSKKWHALKV